MSTTGIEAKLSATFELTQWVVSILAASSCKAVANTVDSNTPLVVAVSMACLIGTYFYYTKMKATDGSSIEIPTTETAKVTKECIGSKDGEVDDDFPCINMVSTDVTESDSDISEEDKEEDWQEVLPSKKIFLEEKNIVSESDGENEDADDDAGDWSEEDYNRRFHPPPRPSTRRTAAKKTTTSAVTAVPQPPSRTTRTKTKNAAVLPPEKKKETLAQMRKRVAREMKESEERRRQQLGGGCTEPTKKPVRKETVAEMKARVAREFAAKLKK